ncbi:hypothetical protein DV515_00001442 [Chloebia gouldiae]|uniref:EDR1/CTR1/ARMC3-like peptidase-like domain-containing protein n=1 Tax=Chloebia gouldiae TaxID=44316 RepID=A0A3L8SY28_CHLGU|nr:hypothetical protein DV515_00001442 [Chloebia gouldiae]
MNTLNAQRDGAISNAIAVLTNLSLQEPSRVSIQSHGIMSALVGPLHSTNSQVQSRAAFAVAAFGCDADARTELRNVGGLAPLVELLHSKNEEVRRNACWAVMVCGSDELNAVELCRLGALDILEEINLSTKRKNKFSEAALEKLLDNNLSQKYSRMGYLSSSNIITNGFYDCGQIKHGGKFLSLEELSKQELTDRREIIFINAKPQEKFVADKMGGTVLREQLYNFCWELDMSEIEFELKSNIVPIAKIKRGTFCHRALLFKVIADRIGIGCSLVRGKYNRAWNEVQLVEHSPKGLLLPPQEYVVDLMFEPGRLLKQGSAKADQYKCI